MADSLLRRPSRSPPMGSQGSPARSPLLPPQAKRTAARAKLPSVTSSSNTHANEDTGKSKGVGHVYKDLMVAYPVCMNGLVAGVLSAAGNITSQLITGASMTSLQWVPVLHLSLISALVMTPMFIRYLGFLYSTPRGKGTQVLFNTVFGAVVMNGAFVVSDVIFKALACALFGVQCSHSQLAGSAFLQAQAALLQTRLFSWDFVSLAVISRKVYLPCDLLCIFIVPPMWQPVVSNVFAFIWAVVYTLFVA